MQIHQERSSNVTSRTIATGGGLVRNEINAALTGEGASLSMEGLFVLSGKQHVDNHTVIDHVAPHCDSVELFKGILDENARGIFDGRIIVEPDAVKTNSRQTNKNLLLSETAVIDSKPSLEIHNDDVKCNHGSTIGQLDEEALFYLRARGIGAEEARNLLVYAFASEIVERMKVDVVRENAGRALFAACRHGCRKRDGDESGSAMSAVLQSRTPSPSLDDRHRIRRDFPILTQPVRGGRPLVYLDNAATTQKPRQVIDRIVRYYTEENSNVHRGVHYLSEIATDAYEKARTTVKRFINARDEKEIVFTRGTTEGINLVAQTWGRRNVGAGDEIAHHRHRASLEHRPVADALRGKGRAASRRAGERCRRSHPRRIREAADARARRSSPSATLRTPSAPSIRSAK